MTTSVEAALRVVGEEPPPGGDLCSWVCLLYVLSGNRSDRKSIMSGTRARALVRYLLCPRVG